MVMVTGQVMIAKGRECCISISTTIQRIDPRQNDARPITRQMLVALVTSNLLRQDSIRPGNRMLVIGSHAHCLQSYFVMEGITSMVGFWNMLMMQLLYETWKTQCTKIPTIAYRSSRLTVKSTAKESDLSLRSFIRATIVQIAIKSLTNHCPLSNQYKGMKNSPIIVDIKSSNLMLLYNFILKLLQLHSQSSYEVQTVTPAAPIMLPAT